MCGLVGIGDFRPQARGFEHDLFSQLLVASSVRGTQGTGIVKVYTNGASDWRKISGDPYTLFQAEGVRAFMNNYDKKNVRFLLGHNRSATTGDLSNECAHPFTIGDITLMHNGTLEKSSTLPDFDKFPVDSEAICNSIEKEGIEKTLGNIRGAYSLVYYNGKTKELNLIRNKERPLYLGVHLEMGRIYFASEFGMLKWVLTRNNITTAKIEMLPEHTLLTWKVNEFIPKMTDMKDHIYKFKSYFGGSNSYWSETYQPRKWNPETKDFEDVVEAEEIHDLTTKDFIGKKKEKKQNKKRKGTALTVVKNAVNDFFKPNGVLTQIDSIFGYRKGGTVGFSIVDYSVIDKAQESWRVEGDIQGYPQIQVFCYVRGNKLLDSMLETTESRGTITNMQYNADNVKDTNAKHRMWIKDPFPVKEKEVAAVSSAEVDETDKWLKEQDRKNKLMELGFEFDGLGADSIN